ncbi:MAG: hypothetical protein WDW38_007143 [Sanguina aurantia]
MDFENRIKINTAVRTRERTGQPIWVASSADDAVRLLVTQISPPAATHASIRASLDVLLTEVAPFKLQNQETLRQAGGIEALATLLQKGVEADAAMPAKDGSMKLQQDVVLYTLYVLHALSSTDDLLMPIALQPGCLSSIVYYLGSSNATKLGQQLALAAANVLVNLTYSGSNAAVQRAVHQARTLDAVVLLLMRAESDPLHEDAAVMTRLSTATTKCAVWLMDHLTAAHGSPARKAVMGQRLEAAAGMGAIPQLAALLQPAAAQQPLVVAAAMMALSALSVGNEANADSVRSLPGLIPALESQLSVRCDIYTCSHEDPQLVVALHTLVHTLGHMMVAAGDSPPPQYDDLYGSGAGLGGGGGGRGAAAGERAGLPGSISRRDQHLIDSKFMSLGQAAILLGIRLSLSTFDPSSPAAAAASPEALSRAQADAALTSDMVRGQRALHLAEVAHRVNEDCLPRMRSENARLAANALASLYHLSVAEAHDAEPATPCPPTPAPAPASPPSAHPAAAGGEALEVRCDSRLLQTALSVTASLALFPECSAHMAELKMLDEVVALAEHADPLVRLCGERALMSMYLSATAAVGGK